MRIVLDLPFTPEQFARVFVDYNRAIWPIQLLAWALGAAAVWIAHINRPWSARLVFGALALMWMWIGIAYHILHFARINPAAYVFGLAFVLEAGLLAYLAARPAGPGLRKSTTAGRLAGGALIAYGLVIYPLAALLWTHPYPTTPMFGVTPCPTVIFTFGVLLLAEPRLPQWVFIVPALWAVVGGSAAVLLRVPEDWILFTALLAWIAIEKPWRRSAQS